MGRSLNRTIGHTLIPWHDTTDIDLTTLLYDMRFSLWQSITSSTITATTSIYRSVTHAHAPALLVAPNCIPIPDSISRATFFCSLLG